MDFIDKFSKLLSFLILIISLCEVFIHLEARNSQKSVINDIAEVKDFKKLLRTKNNVLVLFINSAKQSSNIIKVFEEAADIIKGEGTMVLTDCSGEAKKLCKKLKVNPDPYVLKHYKDGEFYKNYDRKESVSSMLNFMRDPTGDIPWDEDSSTSGIVHIPDPNTLNKFLRKETGGVMILFYAPWCGFCKQLKPEYAKAALELKGQSVLAAIDVNKPENAIIRSRYNITGFPTLIYFENGVKKFNYEGENNKKSIVEFMKNPSSTPPKPVDVDWSAVENEVKHLTDDTFDEVLSKTESILVMFYAPWCGHCKRLKPEYEKAAETIKLKKINGVLAALDATKEPKTAKKFNINGYPTLKYFKYNEFQFDVNLREKKELIEFMKNPKKPPPPPPPEKPWAEEESEVVHLTTESFKPFLKKKKHVLVMFYAPWCGHCKKTKPEFTAAAENFKDDPKIEFAAVDCTSYSSVCSTYEVKGYPTIKVFHYLNKEPVEDYSGGRTKQDFISFMKKFSSEKQFEKSTPPPRSSPVESKTSEEDSWKAYPNSDLVLHLTDGSFDYSLKKHDSLLIFFYKNDCQQCKKIMKEYSDVALMITNAKLPAKVAAYNASQNKKIASEKSIRDFPSIQFYRKGVFVENYNGEYRAGDIFKYLKGSERKFSETKKDELGTRKCLKRLHTAPGNQFWKNDTVSLVPIRSQIISPNQL